MSIKEIGCCGAYCKTCKELVKGLCKGCKLGYETGERDLKKARCVMKRCCFAEKKLETCADCKEYTSCEKIKTFQDKSGYKYKKYKQTIDYIREYGYDKFLKIADNWPGPYGKLD